MERESDIKQERAISLRENAKKERLEATPWPTLCCDAEVYVQKCKV